MAAGSSPGNVLFFGAQVAVFREASTAEFAAPRGDERSSELRLLPRGEPGP
jgi:hypothetical protein